MKHFKCYDMNRDRLIEENSGKDVKHELQKLNADIASTIEFACDIERGNIDVSIGTNMTNLI